ncbi:unnamed protein product [Lampetra fluviatilis]
MRHNRTPTGQARGSHKRPRDAPPLHVATHLLGSRTATDTLWSSTMDSAPVAHSACNAARARLGLSVSLSLSPFKCYRLSRITSV